MGLREARFAAGELWAKGERLGAWSYWQQGSAKMSNQCCRTMIAPYHSFRVRAEAQNRFLA
jgi:hypothetical protein